MFAMLLCIFALISPLSPDISSIIQSQPVIAQIVSDCRVYSDRDLCFPIGEAAGMDFAEILEDYSAERYLVRMSGGLEGWLDATNLIIPPNPTTDTSLILDNEIEEFARSRGFESPTGFLVLVDISRQQIYVLNSEHEQGSWRLIHRALCSTGTNASPTTRGEFRLDTRGEWFYSERLGAGGKYWIRFNGDYLFHSIPMDEDKQIIPGEDVVGTRLSSGCVRLLLDDAQWLYKNIPDKSTVVIP